MGKNNYMVAQLLEVGGLTSALTGMMLSYNNAGDMSSVVKLWVTLSCPGTPEYTKAIEIANRLASHNNGENKFLRFIPVSVVVRAPRYWWQEFDTYKVGAERLSQSTMHTCTKRYFTQDDFCEFIPEHYMQDLNHARDQQDWLKVKRLLPESFLQIRVVCMNLASLQNMYRQRKEHRLPEWSKFFTDIFTGLPPVMQEWVTGIDNAE